jgi:hypothetical protein
MTVAGLRVSQQSDSGRRQVRVRDGVYSGRRVALERHDFDKGRWHDGWCSFPLCDIRAS